MRRRGGSALHFLHAYLLHRAEVPRSRGHLEAMRLLEAVVGNDGAFARRQPVVYLLLARLYDATSEHQRAFDQLWRYLHLRRPNWQPE